MLAIRLQRVGRKHDPSFRIIVQDSRRAAKKEGGIVEYIGSYNARRGNPQIEGDRAKHWLSVGAQASDTVHNLLVDAKVIDAEKINARQKKTSQKAKKAK